MSRPWLTRVAVVSLLLVHAALLWDSSRRNFVTIDEAAHIPSGIAHWQTGSYSLYRVNPPLARMLAALPVLAAEPNPVYAPTADLVGSRPEWDAAQGFASANALRYMDLVRLARLAGIVWSLLGGWVVYRWARDLYGERAGLLGLALWCFEPNILAHAQLVTPDLPATVAGLTASYIFWRYLRQPSWTWAWFAGLLLGVAQLTKFTLLVLYGVWPLLWLIYRLNTRAQQAPAGRWDAQAGQGLLILGLSLLVINLGYGFDGTGRCLGDIPFVSRTFAGDPLDEEVAYRRVEFGNRFRDSRLGSVPVPFPTDYLRGIDVQRRDFEQMGKTSPSYLAGEWKESGWWYYYLYALAVKVPLGIWVMVLWSVILPLWRHPSSARWTDELSLWLPALVVLVLVSSQTGFNHHMRYVLPLFPFVIVSTGKLAYFCQCGHWKAGVFVLALLVWTTGSSLSVHPHSLSYFNELAGGPDQGHEHLVDSNLDWGQDLLFLKNWLDEHPEARPLKLAYFNLVDPRVIGIEFELPPVERSAGGLQEPGLTPGYYAVSASFVQGRPFSAPNGKGGRSAVPLHGYSYFQHFRPIARAGYSIFIYHITEAEANAMRRELGLRPLERPRT